VQFSHTEDPYIPNLKGGTRVESIVRFFFIDIPEAFLLTTIGFAFFNLSIRPQWKKVLVLSCMIAAAGEIIAFFDIPYQLRILSLFAIMNLFLILLFKENIVLSVFISTSAFVANILAEFLVTMLFNAFQLSLDDVFHSPIFQYLGSAGYLGTLALTAFLLRKTGFDVRHLMPQKKNNNYLFWLILVGSIEFLLILFLNTSFIMLQYNPYFMLILSPKQQAFLQLSIFVLFLIMVFLFRSYLTQTITRVEEETETPYLQNIHDLLTAIRSIKHDAINHYTAIHGFLEQGMYDLGREYVKQQLQEAATVERLVETSGQVVEGIKSPAVTALFHSKMAICLADHISFSIQVTSPTQFSFIKTNDLIKVLGNLLDNAIRAAQQEVEENRFIRLVWSQDDTEHFLYIENSGPTIPQEKLARIFELGFTTKQNGEGGVGLAVVKHVIDRYGGDISVHSENGITSFRIAFPR
jgi:signal transduction histidine kinase